MKQIVVILSGGMDSAVLLHHHLKQGDQVRTIGINYGQRHSRELLFAKWQAMKTGCPFTAAQLKGLRDLLPGSSQTSMSIPVPEGNYTADNMKATVVPNRNMILLAVAIGHAIAHQYAYVSYGAHAGDHAIYPDCRPAFADAMDAVASVCDYKPVTLLRPFIDKTKADIVKLGAELGVNFRKTYSCYGGGPVHCGNCGTCVERREAFQLAGVKDPTIYGPDARSLETLLAQT